MGYDQKFVDDMLASLTRAAGASAVIRALSKNLNNPAVCPPQYRQEIQERLETIARDLES
jgi:hypothetical protein